MYVSRFSTSDYSRPNSFGHAPVTCLRVDQPRQRADTDPAVHHNALAPCSRQGHYHHVHSLPAAFDDVVTSRHVVNSPFIWPRCKIRMIWLTYTQLSTVVNAEYVERQLVYSLLFHYWRANFQNSLCPKIDWVSFGVSFDHPSPLFVETQSKTHSVQKWTVSFWNLLFN